VLQLSLLGGVLGEHAHHLVEVALGPAEDVEVLREELTRRHRVGQRGAAARDGEHVRALDAVPIEEGVDAIGACHMVERRMAQHAMYAMLRYAKVGAALC
jgi:hypothetical protein